MRVRHAGIALTAAALLAATPTAFAASGGNNGQHRGQGQDYSMAVIGDVPYGAGQIEAFPGWVDQINADPDVRLVAHVGDIKNGSSECTTDYFEAIRVQFDRFADPLLYTPGDNEWTDCHRTNNGSYDPLERLAELRTVYFSDPKKTNGSAVPVDSQASAGFPENVNLTRAGVDMAVVHVVGSNNGLMPWTGLGATTANAEQVAEETARTANALAVIDEAFDDAERTGGRAVVVMMQADMFDPGYQDGWQISAFEPVVAQLVERSAAFDGEVYLFDGDSHVFNVDQPLAAGSDWLDRYGVEGSANNLTRITVDGAANNTNWLKVTVNAKADSDVVTWEQVPYTQ